MTRIAMLQVADAGPLESLVVMLNSVGYDCYIPNDALRKRLKDVFGRRGLVLSPKDLTRSMGYDAVQVPEAGPEIMSRVDLYVDIKAHQVYDDIIRAWPHLKVLWYRINGGRPEHVVNARGDHGDEVCPPCPVLTPNQWYKAIKCWKKCRSCLFATDGAVCDFTGLCGHCGADDWKYATHPTYTCWPPFVRKGDYDPSLRHATTRNSGYGPPVCFVHGAAGWGYRDAIEPMRELGIRVYGQSSPDGCIPHSKVKQLLHSSLCMVHLKSSDAPGYALYEAFAAGCPVICSGRLIWKCRMADLLRPGYNCLTFDNRETHDGLTPTQIAEDCDTVRSYIKALLEPGYNWTVGNEGRDTLDRICWDPNNPDDVLSLTRFMGRSFT